MKPAAVLLALAMTVATAGPAGAQPEPRRTDLACPEGTVPPSGFTDIAGNVHAPAIDCAAWHEVTAGVTPDTYGPALHVRRDQMATFIARTLEAAGVDLPEEPPHRFSDVPPGGTHTHAVNQLAQLGVVGGYPDGAYRPAAPVRRDQMASFVARAVEHATGSWGFTDERWFNDTAGNAHERAIDLLASHGVVGGYPDGTYRPALHVRRDQMASFLMRALDLVLDQGQSFLDNVEFAMLTGGNVLDDSGEDVAFDRGQLNGLGFAVVSTDGERGELCYGIQALVDARVTAARIHRGPMDANGPVVLSLAVDRDGQGGDCMTAGDVAAQIEQEPDQFHVVVHTTTYPDGALRGQLGVVGLDPALSWANEVADGQMGRGERGAAGGAFVQVHEPTRVVCSLAAAERVTGPFTGHHIHTGGMDVSGPVVVGFPEPAPFEHPEALGAAWVGGGCTRLDGEAVAAIADAPGRHYVNLHTEGHPDGALRGQLDGLNLDVALSADEVVGGGEPGATGEAFLQLGMASGQLCVYLETDASAPFTGSHVHRAARGEDGPEVVRLAAPAEDTGAATTCVQRTPDDMLDLLVRAQMHYVDVHTQAHPGGAVRGQLDGGAGFDEVTFEEGASPSPSPETAYTSLTRLRALPDR